MVPPKWNQLFFWVLIFFLHCFIFFRLDLGVTKMQWHFLVCWRHIKPLRIPTQKHENLHIFLGWYRPKIHRGTELFMVKTISKKKSKLRTLCSFWFLSFDIFGCFLAYYRHDNTLARKNSRRIVVKFLLSYV